MNAHAIPTAAEPSGNAKPVAVGQNVRSVEIHAVALAKAATVYLATPGYPECADLRAMRFDHYQRCLADLMEVINA
jgi:hypothetical protein